MRLSNLFRARISTNFVAVSCVLFTLAALWVPDRVTAGGVIDWSIDLSSADPGEPLSTALLGHYDLSGSLHAYDQEPNLAASMNEVGFSDWRVGVGRWEASTNLFPTLTDLSPCPIVFSESAATEPDDLALIASRDWFTDNGSAVTLADTLDDSRYSLAYLRGVLDVVDAFGATPFVSIDHMPRALAVNRTPLRTDCAWTFQNQVSNVRPSSAPIFAAAAAGMVERIVEGDGVEPARPVQYWEVWNEPELPNFWDPAFEDLTGPLDRFFEMAVNTLVSLHSYRASSTHPNAANLRFGLGSFATAGVAAGTLTGFDTFPIPLGYIPLDFISFHGYSDDPLDVVAVIDTVAAAAAATTHYTNIEMALAEWGPHLSNSAGDAVYAASIQPALHVSTVLSLGAAAGLDRAHRAIFWDFYPNSIRLGLLDHDVNPRSAYKGYEMLSKLIVEGAVRLTPVGLADGRLDAGLGAVLASQDVVGTRRVLLVNRNTTSRNAQVLLDGLPQTPSRVFRYDNPMLPIITALGTSSEVTIPAESLVVVEFGPPLVPAFGPIMIVLLCGSIAGLGAIAVRRRRA